MVKELLTSLFLWGAQAPDTLETAFLAANIYNEARGESLEGQLCVAYVTIARASENNPTFGGPTLRSVDRDGSANLDSGISGLSA